jgi:hypothetical protein
VGITLGIIGGIAEHRPDAYPSIIINSIDLGAGGAAGVADGTLP